MVNGIYVFMGDLKITRNVALAVYSNNYRSINGGQ